MCDARICSEGVGRGRMVRERVTGQKPWRELRMDSGSRSQAVAKGKVPRGRGGQQRSTKG